MVRYVLVIWFLALRKVDLVLVPMTSATFYCDSQSGSSVPFTLGDISQSLLYVRIYSYMRYNMLLTSAALSVNSNAASSGGTNSTSGSSSSASSCCSDEGEGYETSSAR